MPVMNKKIPMQDLKCNKCKIVMTKKGLIHSSNTKYELYACDQCGNEEMKAINVL